MLVLTDIFNFIVLYFCVLGRFISCGRFQSFQFAILRKNQKQLPCAIYFNDKKIPSRFLSVAGLLVLMIVEALSVCKSDSSTVSVNHNFLRVVHLASDYRRRERVKHGALNQPFYRSGAQGYVVAFVGFHPPIICLTQLALAYTSYFLPAFFLSFSKKTPIL